MDSKGEVVLSVEESGALKVLQHYNLRDLLTSHWPGSLSRHHVAEPQKCSAPVAPRDPEGDFTASLKILFVLMLVVCTVLNTVTMLVVDRQLYTIVTEEVTLLTICAVFVLVPILLKFAINMREQKSMLEALQRTVNVNTVPGRIQHV